MKLLNKKGKVDLSTLNLAFVGHSFFAGAGASSSNYIAEKVHSLPLLSGSGLTVKNYAVSGRRWDQLTNDHSVADAFYVAGKRNVMFTMFAVNNILSGQTGQTACNNAKTAIDSIKAVNSGWEVYDVLPIPVRIFDQATINTYNARLDFYSSEMTNNHKNYNIEGVVNLRNAGSPFALSSYLPEAFATLDPYWASGEKSTDASSTHLNDDGYDIIALLIQQKLRGLGG